MPNFDSFVIPQSASASNSISAGYLTLVGLDVPALETTTTKLEIQYTRDGPEVADASATWKPIYDKGTTKLAVTVIAATPRYSYLIPGSDGLAFGRIRLVAATDAGVPVAQATAARTIVPRFQHV